MTRIGGLRVSTPARRVVLRSVADAVLGLPDDRVLQVAIDGVDGAGKTTFGDELADVLERAGRPVIRASVDAFHHPRDIRYRRGRDSPRGYFEDSYDYGLLAALLLEPLGPGGTRWYRRMAFDHVGDQPVAAPEQRAAADAILVLDGIFLHRRGLRGYWDYSVLLDVGFHVSVPRGAQRGTGSPDPDAPSNHRYVEGQRIYLRECEPARHASTVIDNEDLAAPSMLS